MPVADGGGNNFADFYKQQQARLFSHIDDTLAAQTQKAITDNFAAIQKAEVRLQTNLGGRKANIGVNFIGAFAHSDNRAIGWQLRTYGGENDAFGANAGIFHRSTTNNHLWGVNAFADFESGDYGNFTRYSIGGEYQNAFFDIAANYYAPITGERNIGGNTVAFSRQGYDAKVRINIPKMRGIKAAAEYYHFDGKHDTKADDGIRYGLEAHPLPNLRFALFYDDNGDKFGGEMAYLHTIGEARQWRNNNGEAFTPDLFAAVSREYSQRIITAAIGSGVSLRITPLMTITDVNITPGQTLTTTMTIPPITTVTRMTLAAITTTTTMTVAAMTTTMTNSIPSTPVTTAIETPVLTASRMASVYATLYFSNLTVTTFSKYLVTLPSAGTSRPYVIVVTQNLSRPGGFHGRDIAGSDFRVAFPNQVTAYTLTVVEGSEDFVSVTVTLTTSMTTTPPPTETYTTITMSMTVTTTMTTPLEIIETPTTIAEMTTFTTMTITAITTTTRSTTFATITITLGANAAAANTNGDGNGDSGNPPLMPSLPKLPQMALAGMPILHHQRRQTSPSSSFPHSIYRHSRAAGAGISLRPKGAPIMPHKRHH